MKRHAFLTAVCMVAVLALGTARAEPLPAPLAVGSRLSHSLCEQFFNGPHAGSERSLICDLAGRPAVLIYARETTPTLLRLLKKLDAVAEKGQEHKMKSSCVLLTGRDEDARQMQTLAQHANLNYTILAATPLQWKRHYFGNIPGRRNIDREAEVTVILLQRLTVQSSHAFRKGELKDQNIDEIVKAAAALLPRADQ